MATSNFIVELYRLLFRAAQCIRISARTYSKLALFLFVVPFLSSAYASPLTVNFAGVALVGDRSMAPQRFPYLHAISKQKISGISLFDHYMITELKKTTFQNLSLNFGLSNSDHGYLSAAVGILSEDLKVTPHPQGHGYLNEARLTMQLMVVDYKTKQLIWVAPIKNSQLAWESKKKPSQSEVLVHYKKIISGEFRNNGYIFSDLAKQVSKLNLKLSLNNSIQVTKVTVLDDAKQTIRSYEKDPSYISNWLGQSLTNMMSSTLGVTMLPYLNDHLIGRRMALSFSDGEVFTFNIPEPDYEVQLTLRGLRSSSIKKGPVKHFFGHASYHKIKLIEPFSQTVYLDTKFKYAQTSSFQLTGNETGYYWDDYTNSILMFYKTFSENLNKPKSKWLKQTTNGKLSSSDVKKIRSQIIERARM